MVKIRKRVGINPEHQEWLENQESFNLSGFVRESLDKEMGDS